MTWSISGFVVVMLISEISADTFAEVIISFKSGFGEVISISTPVASDHVDCEVVSIL